MTVYFTADLHLGHAKVAETRDKTIEFHDSLIRAALCKGVTKRDQVWILGDLSAGGRAAEEAALNTIAECKAATRAEYHLIPGNHDSCHPQQDKGYRRAPRFLEVFDSVQPFTWRKIGGRRVLLSHYPYRRDHTTEPRHMQWRLPDTGKWLLHGHTHQTTPMYSPPDAPAPEAAGDLWAMEKTHEILHGYVTREICVGLDAWQSGLVTQEQIADLIASTAHTQAA